MQKKMMVKQNDWIKQRKAKFEVELASQKNKFAEELMKREEFEEELTFIRKKNEDLKEMQINGRLYMQNKM